MRISAACHGHRHPRPPGPVARAAPACPSAGAKAPAHADAALGL